MITMVVVVVMLFKISILSELDYWCHRDKDNVHFQGITNDVVKDQHSLVTTDNLSSIMQSQRIHVTSSYQDISRWVYKYSSLGMNHLTQC